MANRIAGDLLVDGLVSPGQLVIPPGTLRDDGVAADAAIAASKLQHQHQPAYRQPKGQAVASQQALLHAVRSAAGASLVEVVAVLGTPCTGDATVTVDVKDKNGNSLLTSTIQFSSSDGAYAVKKAAAAASAAQLSQNDVLVVDVQAAPGTGSVGQDLLVFPVIRENAD